MGEGPGEFQLALGDAWRGPGDTIVTTDISTRIQHFAPNRFYTARGDVPEVSVWRPDGSLDRIVRWRAARRAVTGSDLDAYRAHASGASRDPNEARRVEQLLRDAPRTDSLPSIRSLIEDEAGNLWVESYRHSWEPQPVWQVFDLEGRWMAAVHTPPRFRIHQIGDDHLLGVWRDEDDVEHIRVYPLVR